MKRLTILVITTAAILYLGGICAFAQRPSGAGGHAGGAGQGRGEVGQGHREARPASKGETESAQAGKKTPGELLQHNTKLASKLASLLPAGTDLQQAAQGFKNLGQFVAAVHVSNNLGIPFGQLKSTMTGPPRQSLGKAIHTLKPEANSKEEAKKGQKEANGDIKESESGS